jgi:lysophospholipase L1-like esterase
MSLPPLAALAAAAALVALTGPPLRGDEPAPFALHPGDRVLFYGDSITDQNLYTSDVETYVLTRFPALQATFRNAGWGGDTVTGGGGGPIDVRLSRDVVPFHPTVMTVMLGMNDGHYRALEPAALAAYAQGMAHILDVAAAALPGVRIYVLQPSAYDDVTRPPGFPGGYNAVLQRFAAEDAQLAAARHLAVVDLNTPVRTALERAKALNPTLAPKLIADRVHPGAALHLVMAAALLAGWNAPAVVTTVAIDAGQMKTLQSDFTQVALLEGGDGLVWDQQDARLPMALNLEDPSIALADQAAGLTRRLNQERLTVTGLADGSYTLTIDRARIGVFSAAQLAGGLNLGAYPTPMARQAQAVLQLVAQRHRLHVVRWRAVELGTAEVATEPVTKLRAALLDELDREEQDLVRDARERAQPIRRHYELVAMGPAAP